MKIFGISVPANREDCSNRQAREEKSDQQINDDIKTKESKFEQSVREIERLIKTNQTNRLQTNRPQKTVKLLQ